MGRSRGGLTSKIHALVDAEGRPVNLRLTGGQIADCTEADALTDDLGEGDILLADKGYDSNAIRAKAAERGAWANIPPKANRKGSHSPAGSTGNEISWSGSSTGSSTSEASPRATTSARKTTSPPSNSSQREYGVRVYESTA
jgi:transposase